jgi:hypothetical protein
MYRKIHSKLTHIFIRTFIDSSFCVWKSKLLAHRSNSAKVSRIKQKVEQACPKKFNDSDTHIWEDDAKHMLLECSETKGREKILSVENC